MLLHEFDPNPRAVINPDMLISPVENMPRVAVSCFSRVTFARMAEMYGGTQIAELKCASQVFPVLKAAGAGGDVALVLAGVGAPNCVGEMEELFQMGVETLIVFGNCGVLDKRIEDCGIIIPTSALRDEGTSFHYAPPSDEIPANPRYIPTMTSLLDEIGLRYTLGKTWTTDAMYRETREKVEKRRKAGAVCVEMECSALMALAQFRGRELFQFFYAGDNLDAEHWDERSLSTGSKLEEKDRVAELAMRLALRIHHEKARTEE